MSHRTLFRRVIAMDRRELWFRALSLGRREVGHAAYLARQPHWRREALVHALRLDDSRLDSIVHALLNREWDSAHRAFLTHMSHRQRRFILDPRDRAARADAVRSAHPNATTDAIRRGENLIAGRFDLLGYRNLMLRSRSRHPATSTGTSIQSISVVSDRPTGAESSTWMLPTVITRSSGS